MRNLRIPTFMRSRAFAVTTTGVVSFAAGAATAYAVTKEKLKKHYEAIADEEIAKTREHFAAIHKLDKFASPEEMVKEKYGEAVEGLEYAEGQSDIPEPVISRDDEGKPFVDYSAMSTSKHTSRVPSNELPVDPNEPDDDDDIEEPEGLAHDPEPEDEIEDRTVIRRRVFDHQPIRSNEDWNWAEVHERRTNDPFSPYVITKEEWDENEHDFSHEEYRYYEGDDILTEEDGTIVPDTHSVVGNDNLLSFGVMSGDPNVVYIRREAFDVEYKVERINGKFTEYRFGVHVDDEETSESMSHSDMRGGPRVRRMRDG